MTRRRGCTRLCRKNQVTIRVAVLERAGIAAGTKFQLEADDARRIVLEPDTGLGERRREALRRLAGKHNVDAHHDAAVAAITARREDDLRVPAAAYSEALVVPAWPSRGREGGPGEPASGDRCDRRGTAERAARLRAGHGWLRLSVALVLGHAESTEVDELLTTDARWKRFSRRVRVVR